MKVSYRGSSQMSLLQLSLSVVLVIRASSGKRLGDHYNCTPSLAVNTINLTHRPCMGAVSGTMAARNVLTVMWKPP